MRREDIILEVYKAGYTWRWAFTVKKMFVVKCLSESRFPDEKTASESAGIAIDLTLAAFKK